MAKLKAVAIILAAFGLTAAVWLHEHDRRLKMQVIMHEKEQELKTADKQIEGFRQSVVLMNKEYSKLRVKYNIQSKARSDSTAKLNDEINWLTAQITPIIPDSARHMLAGIKNACDERYNVAANGLSACDSMRIQAEHLNERKDTLIRQLADDRDNYKNLYEYSKSYNYSGGVWATVGKGATGITLLGIVTHFLGLW